MTNFIYEEVATFNEWETICTTWSKPSTSPARKMGSLSDDDVNGKVVTCYPHNTDRAERDIVLIKRAGASTPDASEDFWGSGANSFLDEEYPETA